MSTVEDTPLIGTENELETFKQLISEIPVMDGYAAIEGPDGVGKTTWVESFRDYMTERKKDIRTVREPGETLAGKMIRKELLSGSIPNANHLNLFLSDRLLTQQMVVRPYLDLRSGFVLTDRNILSTLVYQGLTKTASLDDLNVEEANRILRAYSRYPALFLPRLIFVGHLDPTTCLQRIVLRAAKAGLKLDAFEEQAPEKLQQVHLGFNWLAATCEEIPSLNFKVVRLDFSKPLREINETVYKVFEKEGFL